MCTNCNFNVQASEAFAGKLVDTLNAGSLSIMLSLGHRSGLFDAMASMPQAATSEEIAGTAGLNERYVREWLGALVCADVVNVDETGKHYHLPPEHATFLASSAGVENIAIFAQYIPLMGKIENQLLECFRNGGGLGYEEYDRFHEVMADDSGQSVMSSLFEHILPLIPGIESRLEQGIRVLDLGCGRGKAIHLMAAKYPNSTFLGIDYCQEPIEYARKEARKAGLKNLTHQQGDATHLNFEESFDMITTFDAIHDQARPDLVLKNIQNALKAGGVYLMQDIDASSNVSKNKEHPLGTFLYTVSTTHCMTVSLAQEGGMGLGTMWGREKARELLEEAGFSSIRENMLDHDMQNRYYVMEK